MTTATCTVPGLAVASEGNRREHWSAVAKRKKKQREAVGKALLVLVPYSTRRQLAVCPRLAVTLTRVYCGRAKPMDEGDNLCVAFKAVRDEVAAWLGRSDAPDSGISWNYLQLRGEATEVHIHVEELP